MNHLLITKLKTTNIGNQALSDELITLYEGAEYPFKVVGRPTGLFGYSIEKLSKSKDPISKFEQWADGLVNTLKKSNDSVGFTPSVQRVELLSFSDFKVKNDKFFQSVKNIFRKHLHSDYMFSKAYEPRFRVLNSSDSVIYSGAGEVGDNNIFLRQLLELRIAQKLGKKTYAINQSVEVIDDPVKSICSHVYSKMDSILVRGHVSKEKMIHIGIPENKINCCPDSAFLNKTPNDEIITKIKNKYSIKDKSVGINSTIVADDMLKWGKIIQKIRSLGYHIYFISNDPFGDKRVGEKMSMDHKVTLILEFMHYHEYSALLANFEFVISCRLHTNELSLTGKTPIIPIEGSHFKTKEVFSFVNYPVGIISTSNVNWDIEVIKAMDNLHADKTKVEEFIEKIDEVRALSHGNLVI